MKKRKYYIPTIEVITLRTERLMDLGNGSNVAEPGGAPPRRDPAF